MNITAFAQYAGVSKAAVSRYFNGGYLSAEKRAQIAAAVEATGYRPSMQAQMLRTRRTRQIGVIMPRLSSESCARMVEGISRVLDDQNYQLLLINTANDNTREVRALDTLRHDTVDGIILIATMFTPEHHAVLQSLHVPVVIVGQQYPGFSCVFHDDFGAAQAATAHMLQKGRRKPGYLGVTLLDKAVGLARREGFDSALRGCRSRAPAAADEHCQVQHGIRLPPGGAAVWPCAGAGLPVLRDRLHRPGCAAILPQPQSAGAG